MKKKKIILVTGARPNFMKIAPLMKEFKKYRKHFDILLVHTGQHYDFEMSDVFFRDLTIPTPDIHLEVGPDSHAEQIAKIMLRFEKVLLKEKPDLVMVVGDVNSTVACSLAASELSIKVAHVEAGLRSFDYSMPEEINRIVTDSISDYLFVSEPSGLKNLRAEGIDPKKVFFVGNIMIDTLLQNIPKIEKSDIHNTLSTQYAVLSTNNYAILTLHRPSNVDSDHALQEIYSILKEVTKKIPIIYPIHPRTRKMIMKHGVWSKFKKLANLKLIDPLGYVDFVALMKDALVVLTDSGGIQEETTVLKVPCLTMRENTERTATLKGSNRLVGRNKTRILRCVSTILNGKWPSGTRPKYWDGKTAGRIVKLIADSS